MALSNILHRRVRPAKVASDPVEHPHNADLLSIGTEVGSQHAKHGHPADDFQKLENLYDRQSPEKESLSQKASDSESGEIEGKAREEFDTIHSDVSTEYSGLSESSISRSPNPRAAISSISFGALASAQASLGRKRKRGIDSSDGMAERVRPESPFHEAEERRAGKKKSHPAIAGRGSKHAPAELSTKRAVTRKRQVVGVPNIQARDPRFSSLSGTLDTNRVQQNYAFLDDYRASEITELKQQIRTTKDASTREVLKRSLKSMEDRERARKRVDEEKSILREHKKAESDKIKQGKKPFFLKKGEVKKQALVRRFENMGEKKVEKAMERRRKKKAGKERRAMPSSRREVG